MLLDLDGPGRFDAGSDEGIAPARNAIVDQDGKPLGRIVTSVARATTFATRLEEVAEVGRGGARRRSGPRGLAA